MAATGKNTGEGEGGGGGEQVVVVVVGRREVSRQATACPPVEICTAASSQPPATSPALTHPPASSAPSLDADFDVVWDGIHQKWLQSTPCVYTAPHSSCLSCVPRRAFGFHILIYLSSDLCSSSFFPLSLHQIAFYLLELHTTHIHTHRLEAWHEHAHLNMTDPEA